MEVWGGDLAESFDSWQIVKLEKKINWSRRQTEANPDTIRQEVLH